jgi:hypothetical protein
MTQWHTTMAAIRAHNPCKDGWKKLIAHTGLAPDDATTPVSFLTIFESNGLDDALWCLRAIEGKDREIRLFTVWCARQVRHLMTDKRSIDALAAARDATRAAARAAARDAARAAARDAARAAARAATRAAAWDAARAALDAAWAAAWDAARDAARAAQAEKFKDMVSA